MALHLIRHAHPTDRFFGFRPDRRPSLAIRQIYPDDRAAFSASWGELGKGKREISCDYRFFTKGSGTLARG